MWIEEKSLKTGRIGILTSFCVRPAPESWSKYDKKDSSPPNPNAIKGFKFFKKNKKLEFNLKYAIDFPFL